MTGSKSNQTRFSKITPAMQGILKKNYNIDHTKLLLPSGQSTTKREEIIIDGVIKERSTRKKLNTPKQSVKIKSFKIKTKSLDYLIRITKEVKLNV